MLLSTLLESLPPNVKDQVIASATHLSVKRHQTILRSGEPMRNLIYVADGLLRMDSANVSNRLTACVGVLRRDDLYLDALLQQETPSGVCVTAVVPSQIYLLPLSKLDPILGDYPALLQCLLHVAVRTQRGLRHNLAQRLMGAPGDTLLLVMRQLAVPDKQGYVHIPKAVSQSDLGEFAHLSREKVNRILKQLEDAGSIVRDHAGITLPPQKAPDAIESSSQAAESSAGQGGEPVRPQ